MKIQNQMNSINVSSQANNNFFKKDKIFKATIFAEDTNKFFLKNNDVVFSADKDSLNNAKVGDTLDFQVMDDGEQLQIKNINDMDIQGNMEDIAISEKNEEDVLDLFKNQNMITDYEETDIYEESETDRKIKDLVKKISGKVSYASGNVSASAIAELVANGVSITEIDLSTLNSIVGEMESRPIEEISADDIKEVTQKYIEEKNNLQNQENVDNISKIIKVLEEKGIDMSDNNIDKMSSLTEKAQNLSKDSYIGLLKNDLPATIDNLYTSSYAITENSSELEHEDLYSQLAQKFGYALDDVKDIFSNLLANDIDVTEENTSLSKAIIDLVENMDDTKARSLAAFTLNNPEASILDNVDFNFKEILNNNLDLKDRLQNIDLNNSVAINNSNISLGEYVSHQELNIDAQISYSSTASDGYRKEVLTIQLKMTYEASLNLAHKGIDLNTESIENALSSLIEAEQEVFASSFKELNLSASNENVSLMTDFYNTVNSTKSLFVSTYNSIINEDINFNYNEINQSQLSNMTAGYEVFETLPKLSQGESFNQIFDQIAPLLEDMGIEPTEKNIRATEILSRSNVELTYENIVSVKNIDIKLETLSSDLNPKMVANLIDKGFNPLNMNVDELIEYIDKYNEEFGKTTNDKLVDNLIAMQKDKDVDEDTYSAVKSVYRVLNIIGKRNNRSVGALVESEQNLTLDNLLNNEKYLKNIKYNTDYTFKDVADGEVESVFNEEGIRNIIENAVSKPYNQNVLNDFMKNATYENLKDFVQQDGYENLPLEDVNFVNKVSESIIEENLAKIATLENITYENIEKLVQTDLPTTIDNLLSTMKEDTFETGKKLKKIKEKNDNITFEELSKEGLDGLKEEGNLLDITIGEVYEYDYEVVDLPTTQSLLQDLKVLNGFNKAKDSEEYNATIKLPFSNEDTFVNMFVLNDNMETKSEKTIGVALNTSVLGDIKVTANISDNKASIKFIGNEEALNKLKSNEDNLMDKFDIPISLEYEEA